MPINIKNPNQNKNKITNKKVNNSTKKIFNQKLSNKNLSPIFRNSYKNIKFNKGNFSEFNTFINSPGKLIKNRQNINNESHIYQKKDSFFKNNL